MDKKKIIIIALAAMLIAVGIFGWKFIHGPKFSLLQIQSALENHNYTEFEKYVDVDGLMTSCIDQIFEMNQGSNTETSFSHFGSGLLEMLKPQLSHLYKPQIQKWVESGKFEASSPARESNLFPIPDYLKRAGGVSMTGIEYEKREGDIALIGIRIKPSHFDTVLVISIKMRNRGDYWQVEGLGGLARFQNEMERLEQNRVDRINKPIRDEMLSSLKIAKFDKIPDRDTAHKSLKVLIALQNTSAKIISEYNAVLSLSDTRHSRTREIRINTETLNTLSENLAPQRTNAVILPADATMYHDPWLHDAQMSELVLNLSIASIQFSDGTSLRLQEKWQR